MAAHLLLWIAVRRSGCSVARQHVLKLARVHHRAPSRQVPFAAPRHIMVPFSHVVLTLPPVSALQSAQATHLLLDVQPLPPALPLILEMRKNLCPPPHAFSIQLQTRCI